MKLKSLRNVAIIAAMCTLVAGSVAATDNQQQDRKQDRDTPVHRQAFDLEFKGGSVADYIAAVKRRLPGTNVITMPDVDTVAMPRVELHSVTIGGALELLNGHTSLIEDGQIKIGVNVTQSGSVPPNPIFTVSAMRNVQRMRAAPASSLIVAIGDLVSGPFTAEQVLDAVDTAVGLLAGEGPSLKATFHAETSLLIARGTPQQIGAVANVIEQLGIAAAQAEDAKRRQAAMDQMQTRQADLEAELSRTRDFAVTVERDRAQLDARVNLLSNEITRKLDALDVRDMEIARLESKLRDLQARLGQQTATNTRSDRNPK